ncbi:MAG: bifunctional metallophosphatase/5'-nucleotidase [Chloroflexi bacterium]|nr:bifunctional metallophosphatase/5'-nucleotidase [Chloroflexota bacterium]
MGEIGALRLIEGTPNPRGEAEARVFLLVGNPTIAPVRRIILDNGVQLPERRSFTWNEPGRVKVLHINDLHGHICRLSPGGETPVFSKIVGHIRATRRQYEQDPNVAVLAMSAGDDLVGFVFDELLGDDESDFQMHVGYHLYSAGGMDVAALGNHDLDMGAAALARSIRHDARFPLLSANLVANPPLDGLYFPAALFVSKGIRVGVIGLTTPGQIRQLLDANIHVASPIQVVHNLLPALQPLCDVIIILSHLGYSLQSRTASVRDAGDVELARTLPRGAVHLIVGGHTHHALNEQGLSLDNIVNGIPIVQAGTLGQYVGEVDITVTEQPAVTHVRLNRTPYLPTDETFEREYVRPIAELAMPILMRDLGRTADHPDLSTDYVRNYFARGESAFANFMADALVERARVHGYAADLAFVDASTARIGVPVGETLTFGDWFNVMPFADTLRLYWLTGAQLKQLVEDNARRVDRPGEPHTERGFLHFSRQLRYTIILGETRSDARAVDIRFQGRPIDELLDRSFLAVCSSFIREPAAAWENRMARRFPLMQLRDLTHLDTGLFLRDEMVFYIQERGGVTEEAGARRDGRVVCL